MRSASWCANPKSHPGRIRSSGPAPVGSAVAVRIALVFPDPVVPAESSALSTGWIIGTH